MAKLILTEEEKAAGRYLDWDDASLGQMVRALCETIRGNEKDIIGTVSASYLLIAACLEAGSEESTWKIEGVTMRGEPVGNWEVTVRELK